MGIRRPLPLTKPIGATDNLPETEVPTGIRIPLSGGNLRNGHFSLRSARHLLPSDSIGGSSRAEVGRPVHVTFRAGIAVETDTAGDKMIL